MKLTYIYKTSRGNLRERKLTYKELDQILLRYDKLADINNTNNREKESILKRKFFTIIPRYYSKKVSKKQTKTSLNRKYNCYDKGGVNHI